MLSVCVCVACLYCVDVACMRKTADKWEKSDHCREIYVASKTKSFCMYVCVACLFCVGVACIRKAADKMRKKSAKKVTSVTYHHRREIHVANQTNAFSRHVPRDQDRLIIEEKKRGAINN